MVETSRRPGGGAFKQQRLPAWQPLLTPSAVIPTYITLAIIFIPVGIVLLLFSQSLQEYSVEYTGVTECELKKGTNVTSCTLQFDVKKDMDAPVYAYYKLTNFYQNHRRYVRSRNDEQLRGNNPSFSSMEDCDPRRSIGDENDPTKYWNPCGLIAASMFNDTFALKKPDGTDVAWTKSGIAWESDVDEKFKKQSKPVGIQPTTWPPGVDSVEDEDFIVWMRTAGLPHFKKLHRIIDTDLSAGTYTLTVNNRFPVEEFDGTKQFVLATTSSIGGRNMFLAFAYIVVGLLCLTLGIVFLLRNSFSPRILGDQKYLAWDRKL
eukprot:TRINITY_DN25608_c0_g1_i2.p1 TRINITY_DN25608_c0_g1~~TRINITY_DN25608_c0_g1_i2.p1  ORF type:complete len:319 (+),score=46.50 TRINITY_DN25608_c0_g1_i2:58-1014(+)